MLAAGVPIAVVSKRLGHSTIALTADTYSHLMEGIGRDAAERAMELVPRKRTPEGLQGGSNEARKTPLEKVGVGIGAGQRVPLAGLEPATRGVEGDLAVVHPVLSRTLPSHTERVCALHRAAPCTPTQPMSCPGLARDLADLAGHRRVTRAGVSDS